MKWQPIETAPKDEIIIITDGRDVGPGWGTGHRIWPWAFIDDTSWVEEMDTQDFIKPNGYTEKHIKFWHPMPELPKDIVDG